MNYVNDKLFETSDRPVRLRLCDHPDCGQAGEYRAPKSREKLSDYYYFCLDHVRQYNRAWDYFEGLSPEEIESYIRAATVWERETWPLGQRGPQEQHLREKALRDVFGDASCAEESAALPPLPIAERHALAILELEPPVDFAAVKVKYHALVKKHHPDVRGATRDSGEKFKDISIAFATLRKFYASGR